MKSKIRHIDNKFYKIVDNLECLLEYNIQEGKTIVFYHTYVPEPLRGKGLAIELIKVGLDFAVRNNYKIIPICSAVRKFIDRNMEFKKYLYEIDQ